MTELAGVGVGLVETPRFERALRRFGKRLLTRVFSPEEAAYAAGKRAAHHNLAARFAAKCAGRRALRTLGKGPVRLADLEVVRQRSGEPTLVTRGELATRVPSAAYRFQLSLTHDSDFAMASVWLERRGPATGS